MSAKVTRRDIAKLSGAIVLGTGVGAPSVILAQTDAEPVASGGPLPVASFPEGFLWGVATAAYQIEGGAKADGKGPSIWDTYAHIPGKMKNGDTGDVAIDHYNRYQEDVGIMRDMGVNAYRFSIAWPRILPEGTGTINEAGIDFYSRLVDAQLEAGIAPYATLYHWDLPQALQDKGGWQSRDTSQAFADYAGLMAERLGDRVKHFFTLNELNNFVGMGHQGRSLVVQGRKVNIELAPGLQLSQGEVNQVAHHAVLAHGLAVQAIRARGVSDIQVGPADVLFSAVPLYATPENVEAAKAATESYNWQFLDAMLNGRYSDDYLASAGADAPKFTDADIAAIGSPLDFVGVNIYLPKAYVVASEGGFTPIPTALSHPKMGSEWHSLSPEVYYWGPKFLHEIWGPKAIYITENGCAADDTMTETGEILDTDRIMYLRAMMTSLSRAISEGAPIKGNFVWSAFDNLEWTDGFGRRFGLVHVDYETLERTPKKSAEWFRSSAAANAVM